MITSLREYLLIQLASECAEVAHVISKALQFGPWDRNILNVEDPPNIERIQNEMADLLGVAKMLEEIGLPVRHDFLREGVQIRAKKKKVLKYLEYAIKQDRVSPEVDYESEVKEVEQRKKEEQAEASGE